MALVQTKFIHGPEVTRELPIAADYASGKPFAVGAFVGVTLTKEGSGVGNADGYATVGMGGATQQPVSTATAVAVGVAIYVIAATGVLTPSSSGNVLFGYALTPKSTTVDEVIAIELHRV